MKENGFRVFSFVLSVLCAMGFSLYAAENAKATDGRNALNAVYQRSFYEAAETLESMQVTLKKLSQANSGHLEIEYLSDVSKMAESIQGNLAALPAGDHSIAATMKFVNQAGDLADSLLKKIAAGGAVSIKDRENLSEMLTSVTDLALTMNEYREEYLSGRKTFGEIQNANAFNLDSSAVSEPLDTYPVLLYDGPFSDSVKTGQMKAVTGENHTPEEAEKKLYEFLGERARSIKLLGINQGEVEIYEFSLKLGSVNAYAGVTRTGGHTVYVLSEYVRQREVLAEEECIKIAAEYLENRLHGEFTSAYFQKYDGVITVNLAPVQDGVILYPDLVKVEVSMETGEVIGLEATNYFTNHVERKIEKPGISASDAMKLLSDSTLLGKLRLSLIPFGNAERLAYEAHTIAGRDEYLVYIDAHKGYEIEIFELVHLDEGTIVQ